MQIDSTPCKHGYCLTFREMHISISLWAYGKIDTSLVSSLLNKGKVSLQGFMLFFCVL